MQKVRIRISDGSLQWVPEVAVIRDGIFSEYYHFLSKPGRLGVDKVYAFTATGIVNDGYSSNMDIKEVEAMEECSVAEFNFVIEKIVNRFKI